MKNGKSTQFTGEQQFYFGQHKEKTKYPQHLKKTGNRKEKNEDVIHRRVKVYQTMMTEIKKMKKNIDVETHEERNSDEIKNHK